MIKINSYIHRDVLYDVILRWMYHDIRPDDALLITRLVAFNNTYVSRYLHLFSQTFFQKFHNSSLTCRTTHTKGDLKDVIVANTPAINPRIQELINEYTMRPERYYRETPFCAKLYFAQGEKGQQYVGSHRIKRVRRLAEKSARRIIDRIFEAIKARANALADDRAKRLGIPRQYLVTRPEDMIAEFTKAESRLLDDLRNRRPIPSDGELAINDVAGIKVITADSRYQRVVDLIREDSACEVIEIEPHLGNYNATNLIVRYKPPKAQLFAQPLSENTQKLMRIRGMEPEQANRAFTEFVEGGEAEVNIEVIISNYQDMLESEIGRCMHEDRIIEQRLRQEYRAHLAKNIEYLMEYLFAFATSPQREISELPIKLWNRYLPDYFDDVVKKLFNIPPIQVGD
jgi:hypothetical protein